MSSEHSNTHFIFVNDIGRLSVVFDELRHDKRVTMLDGPYKPLKNRVLLFLRKIHTRRKINNIIKLPFKGIWSCSLKGINWNKETKYYVIFDSASIYPIKVDYLKSLQNEYDIKYIMVMNDHFLSPYAGPARKYISNLTFEYIFTIDNKDAEERNFIFSDAHYSIIYKPGESKVSYDICFTGLNKGRLDLLYAIYDGIQKNSLASLYRIVHVKKSQQKYDGIIYNQFITYEEVIKEALKCNCILEILFSGQTGATLRYYEAVCYNKKLLTNNKNVVNLPFYNPDYIHVFEKPEDIDWNWVKERVPVDYHYDGRFSPTHLIDKIIELEEEKERNELGKVETD